MSLKVRYAFSQKDKLTCLTARKSKKIVLLIEFIKKIWLSILQCTVGIG